MSISDLHLNFQALPSCQPGHTPFNANEPAAYCDTPGSFLTSVIEQVRVCRRLCSCRSVCHDKLVCGIDLNTQVECGALALLIPGDTIRHAYNGPVTQTEALSTYEVEHVFVSSLFAVVDVDETQRRLCKMSCRATLQHVPM